MTEDPAMPVWHIRRRFLVLSLLEGVMAWAVYCVLEFVFSGLLYRVTRPYADFAKWYWGLTASLAAGFLAIGLLAGLVGWFALSFALPTRRLTESARLPLLAEHSGTLTLVLAFGAYVAVQPGWPDGKITLLILSVAFSGLLLRAIWSENWSEKLGLLGSPWVVSGILLGAGREHAILGAWRGRGEVSGRLLAASIILPVVLVILAIGAVWVGRRTLGRLPKNRTFVWNWVGFAAALLLLCGSAIAGRPMSAGPPLPSLVATSERPNVLLLVMDTVRADHLPMYGYDRETAPNLNQLAQDAAVYTRTIAPSDFTLSSHGSLFTGMYASWHAAHCSPPDAVYGQPLDVKLPTLAGLLAENGYATVGVAANVYLREEFGLQRGFQSFRIPRPVPVFPDEEWYLLRRMVRLALRPFTDTEQFDRLYSRGDDINRQFFSLIIKNNGHSPFFGFINYMDAHFPYGPPSPYDRRFPGKLEGLTSSGLEDLRNTQVPADVERYQQHAISQYDGGIDFIDAQVGQLIQWLKEKNAYDNTMIIVTADHGEAFGEKGHFEHGNSVYQNLIHVPLIIKYPHSEHKGTVDDTVSLIDVMPTILNVLQIMIPSNVQGQTLTASLASRQLFSESFPCPVIRPDDCKNGCLSRALVDWPHKLITSTNGKLEMYDLAADAGEAHNLYQSHDSTDALLRNKLLTFIKTIPEQKRQTVKLDRNSLQQLKGLGYAQ